MTVDRKTYDLEAYVRDVGAIVDRDLPVERAVEEITACNRRLVGSSFRLPDELRTLHPTAPYTRNLVHRDPDDRFAVIAILWGPFQETRIHDHLNWCVVGMLEGTCLAVDYDRVDDGSRPEFADLAVRAADLAPAGTVLGLTPPPRTNIHKMANARREVSVSLHTYGDPGTRARIFDAPSGRVEVMELQFHNLDR